MNKIEKKLRKIKGLYNLLSLKNQNDAIERAKNDSMYWKKVYVDFDFEYNIKFSTFSLNVYKSTVMYNRSGHLTFGNAVMKQLMKQQKEQ